MKLIISLILFLTTMPASAAVSWKCVVKQYQKSLSLQLKSGSYELQYPNSQHIYAIIPLAENLQFIYLNESVNKKNYLRYSVLCPESKTSCLGTFDSTYKGTKTQRALVEGVSSRSTRLLDRNRTLFEYTKADDSFDIHVADSNLNFRCTKK